ncbi:ABC transporter ATP-binding protein [Cryobacterium psychrophilum]|uniref:ABC-type quaternary amine transporter n=1 Tax=Cryobacterium psychrophilum TaxID=41988 RepID=A0A4Y8KYD6_9MICO|nr:ABC transporter ATP-binding protein [Cryobacterium psychrophilum]TDW28734.1 putative spermidine/putrescine transport system ATP-binding protein [Cryobacterium psychrophilum]TFD82391.1 ABC transporter ATP-binding protein [Cryobacterium psychrophilum]
MSAGVLLHEVSKSFGAARTPALTGVTLAVADGSCTAILGPSGSGKSTILRVIAGLDEVSGGTVHVDGVDVAGVPSEQRGIGLVFQRPLLFPHLSVLDNVAFSHRVGGASRAGSRRHAQHYLDLVQLGGFGGRPIQALSGGQEQRVAIARALAAAPRVLLLDEPFSALDPALREDMHLLLDDVRSALSPTIILVTHDREEAAAVADRIAVIHNGALLQHDTVDRIYHRPASTRVSRLMGGLNEIPGHVHGAMHVSPLGQVPVSPGTPEGPGILVIRHEAIEVSRCTDNEPSASGVVGHVSRVRQFGPRRMVTVTFGDGSELFAALPPGDGMYDGCRVVLTLPTEAVSVVPR